MLTGKTQRGGRKSGTPTKIESFDVADPLLLGVEASAGAGADAEAGCGDVGRLVDSSQADDRRMIRLVRERRLLYARNNMPVASYYSQVKKLWTEVAEQMGWSVADVRRKWSHIRNSYSRHLRNEMYGVRTGRGRMVSKWYLADELVFLREHMATDTRPAKYSYGPLYLEDLKPKKKRVAASSSPETPQTPAVDLQPFISSPWFALSAQQPAQFPAAAATPTPLESAPMEPQVRLDESSSPLSFEPDSGGENHAYFQFFRSIYPDYRELSVRKQRLFRRECLNLMHRLLEEEDAEQTDAMNLSAAHLSDDDARFCVKQEPDDQHDGELDDTR